MEVVYNLFSLTESVSTLNSTSFVKVTAFHRYCRGTSGSGQYEVHTLEHSSAAGDGHRARYCA